MREGILIRNNSQMQSKNGSCWKTQKLFQKEIINSHSNLHARRCHRWSEASATAQCILCGLSAAEASTFVPTEEASCLAVLEAVLGDGVVALRAASADAEVGCHATSELIMVDAREGQCSLAACILFLSNGLGICQCCLVCS